MLPSPLRATIYTRSVELQCHIVSESCRTPFAHMQPLDSTLYGVETTMRSFALMKGYYIFTHMISITLLFRMS